MVTSAVEGVIDGNKNRRRERFRLVRASKSREDKTSHKDGETDHERTWQQAGQLMIDDDAYHYTYGISPKTLDFKGFQCQRIAYLKPFGYSPP